MGIIDEIESAERVAKAVREKESARLRPLLERCEALVRAQQYLNQGLRRPDSKAGFGDLLADLRAEMGKEEG